jgi:hypothetical protein
VHAWNAHLLKRARVPVAGVGEGHIAAVSAVAFSRRGPTFMVSGGADKLLKVIQDQKLS